MIGSMKGVVIEFRAVETPACRCLGFGVGLWVGLGDLSVLSF